MAVTLHRCGNVWIKIDGHPCWRVQKALDEMGVDYAIAKEAWPNKKARAAVIAGTGQNKVPAIELEDGTWYREESADMVEAIRAGKFGAAQSS